MQSARQQFGNLQRYTFLILRIIWINVSDSSSISQMAEYAKLEGTGVCSLHTCSLCANIKISPQFTISFLTGKTWAAIWFDFFLSLTEISFHSESIFIALANRCYRLHTVPFQDESLIAQPSDSRWSNDLLLCSKQHNIHPAASSLSCSSMFNSSPSLRYIKSNKFVNGW